MRIITIEVCVVTHIFLLGAVAEKKDDSVVLKLADFRTYIFFADFYGRKDTKIDYNYNDKKQKEI